MRIPRLAAVVAVAAIILAACSAPGATGQASGAAASDCSVGVSWNNFQ